MASRSSMTPKLMVLFVAGSILTLSGLVLSEESPRIQFQKVEYEDLILREEQMPGWHLQLQSQSFWPYDPADRPGDKTSKEAILQRWKSADGAKVFELRICIFESPGRALAGVRYFAASTASPWYRRTFTGVAIGDEAWAGSAAADWGGSLIFCRGRYAAGLWTVKAQTKQQREELAEEMALRVVAEIEQKVATDTEEEEVRAAKPLPFELPEARDLLLQEEEMLGWQLAGQTKAYWLSERSVSVEQRFASPETKRTTEYEVCVFESAERARGSLAFFEPGYPGSEEGTFSGAALADRCLKLAEPGTLRATLAFAREKYAVRLSVFNPDGVRMEDQADLEALARKIVSKIGKKLAESGVGAEATK